MALAVAILLFLLVAYPLSMGPVALLHRHGYLPDGVRSIYWPLNAAVRFRPFGDALYWYVHLWGGVD